MNGSLTALLKALSQEGIKAIIIVTQPSYREWLEVVVKSRICFERVRDIEVVKGSVKSYDTILSGRCSIVGNIFSQRSFSAFLRKRNLASPRKKLET